MNTASFTSRQISTRLRHNCQQRTCSTGHANTPWSRPRLESSNKGALFDNANALATRFGSKDPDMNKQVDLIPETQAKSPDENAAQKMGYSLEAAKNCADAIMIAQHNKNWETSREMSDIGHVKRLNKKGKQKSGITEGCKKRKERSMIDESNDFALHCVVYHFVKYSTSHSYCWRFSVIILYSRTQLIPTADGWVLPFRTAEHISFLLLTVECCLSLRTVQNISFLLLTVRCCL